MRAKKEIMACSRIANVLPELSINRFSATFLKWWGESSYQAWALYHSRKGRCSFAWQCQISYSQRNECCPWSSVDLSSCAQTFHSSAHPGLTRGCTPQAFLRMMWIVHLGSSAIRRNNGARIRSCWWEISILSCMKSPKLFTALACLLSPTGYTLIHAVYTLTFLCQNTNRHCLSVKWHFNMYMCIHILREICFLWTNRCKSLALNTLFLILEGVLSHWNWCFSRKN